MKIQGVLDPFRMISAIRNGRTEGDGGAGRNAYDPNQTRKDGNTGQNPNSEQNSEQETAGQDPEVLRQAVDAFHADAANRSSGITAKIEGVSPGLIVTVSDANGRRLRQFSGAEFLRLRDSAASDTQHRGKILDQKL